MRSILTSFALVLAVAATGFAFVEANPAAPSGAISPTDLTGRAPWDVQFSLDLETITGALGNAGSEFDGTYYYSTRWASNLIHQIATDGTLMKEFSIAGVSGLRDLAYDGEYMYGGAASGTIYQMDFDSETLIGTITGGFQSRAIAYNDDTDQFYCSNWGDPVWIVNRDGTTSTFNLVATVSTYGMAYDNTCGSDPMLWVFDQGQGTGAPQYVHEWNLSTGAFTGVTHDVEADFGATGIAGGLWTSADVEAGTFSLGGLLQGTPDTGFSYELCTADNPFVPTIEPLNGTVFNPGDVVEYRCCVTNTGGGPAMLNAEVYADIGAGINLQGPFSIQIPAGGPFCRDFESTIPNSAPPLTVPICVDANGAVDCYNITIQ